MNSLKQNDSLLKELRQEMNVLNELNLSVGHDGSEHCAMAAGGQDSTNELTRLETWIKLTFKS